MKNEILFAAGITLQVLTATAFICFSDNSSLRQFDYSQFQFSSLIIFAGFPLFYSFLKRYTWTGIAHSFILALFSFEFYLLFNQFWYYLFNDNLSLSSFSINFSGEILSGAILCAGSALVGFGALVGQLSSIQVFLMGLMQSFCYSFSEALIMTEVETYDTGRGLMVNIFGSIFGLSASFFYSLREARNHPLQTQSYQSSTYAMIGTLLLWVSWPSMNSILATSVEAKSNAYTNTVVALLGSASAAFFTSMTLNSGSLHIASSLIASITGGIAVSIISGKLEYYGCSLILGVFTGTISCAAIEKLTQIIDQKLKIHDTTGILSLHFIPGLIGWVFAFTYFLISNEIDQGLKELYGFLWVLIISIISGVLFGVVLKLSRSKILQECYLDEPNWIDCNSNQALGEAHYQQLYDYGEN